MDSSVAGLADRVVSTVGRGVFVNLTDRSVAEDPGVDDSVSEGCVAAVEDSLAVDVWQRVPEKPSGHVQPISPVVSSKKQVAPF